MTYMGWDARQKQKKAAKKEGDRFLAWRKKHEGYVTAAEAARCAGMQRSSVSKGIRAVSRYGSSPLVASVKFKFKDGHELTLVKLEDVLGLIPNY